MLPNLLIIGAGKSGTTSLHRYLAQHPQVWMSRRKELQVFTREEWRARLAWYESRFPEPTDVRGESSPSYTMHPAVPSPAGRIRSALPTVKLIYLVRDPIERLLAHYVEAVADGHESRPLERVLDDEGSASIYMCASLYSTQLDQYLRYFASEQILVLDQHDLLVRRAETLQSVFSFLGVTQKFTSPVFSREFNLRRTKVRPNRLGIAAYRKGWAERLLATELPVQPAVARVLGRPIRSPALSASARARLVDAFTADVERLRSYSGRRLASWSV